MKTAVLLALFIIFIMPCECANSTFDIAKKVAEKIYATSEVFFRWEYGGAIIFDGLYMTDDLFRTNYTSILNSWLDGQLSDRQSVAYSILNHKYFPNSGAVGDLVGLFPINYLTRLTDKSAFTGPFNKTAYWSLLNITATDYVLGWPDKLPDGTFSRYDKGNWDTSAKKASLVWADDEFMGLTLLARLSIAWDDKHLAETVAQLSVQYSKYLFDPQDDLIYHGYNYEASAHSCCKWGRGNGWSLMSHIEVLNALDNVQDLHHSQLKDQVLNSFRRHVAAMVRAQDVKGLWHQIVDDSSTYMETSVTSMTLYALTRGVLSGWLTRTMEINNAIMNAWKGLQMGIADDGTVNGICMGTGIQNDVKAYEDRPAFYLGSSPGLGSVLYAICYMDKYLTTYY